MAHRESVVTLQMVSLITDQRRIAQASKRDGNAMKRLSMLGAVFFPGTFLSSIFSMVFFSVQGGESLSPSLHTFARAFQQVGVAVHLHTNHEQETLPKARYFAWRRSSGFTSPLRYP